MKFGILAAGGIAHFMAKTVTEMDGIELWAVASRRLATAEEFAKKYGFKKAYGSYKDLVEDKDVELIYIATPHSHHYENIKLCLEHGKHVLCEKAFCVNAKQAEEVFKLAKEKNLLLTEAIWPRYMPSRKIINDIIESGIIGTPKTLTANLGYQIQNVPRLTDPKLAGGAMLDVGIYPLNFALMHFGSDIKSIKATGVLLDNGVDACNQFTITYNDGRVAILYSTMQAQTDRAGIISGSLGYIEVQNINNPEKVTVYDLDRRPVLVRVVPKQITGFEYEVAESAECISKGLLECPSMPHADSIAMMKIMDDIRAQIGVKYPDLE